MKKNYYKECLALLKKLNTSYPNITLGKHLSTSFNEYNIENLSDKAFYENLQDYLSELDSDIQHGEDIDKIIEGGMNLHKLLEEEDEE